jgi:catechol 2,3-dioxygenase-like lactoylglutathione lyase family enzyme
MKRLGVLLGLAIPMLAGAQNVDMRSDAPVIRTTGAFFALSVADVEASARWYAEKLGLAVKMRAPRTDATKSAMTLLQGGGLTVELVQHDDAVPLRNFLAEPRGALFLHGIFKVGVIVDDFDATIAALRSRGVTIAIGPFPKRVDQPANAIIRDNAGNYIQIFGK